jgi:hypothetical protein
MSGVNRPLPRFSGEVGAASCYRVRFFSMKCSLPSLWARLSVMNGRGARGAATTHDIDPVAASAGE